MLFTSFQKPSLVKQEVLTLCFFVILAVGIQGCSDSGDKASPTPQAKPAPKLEFVVRRGLAVGFAEVQIGHGKVHEVPARGATTLRVRPGTYTLRFRSRAYGGWESIRHTFSPGMKYAGNLELNGLRIMAVPDKER